MRREKILIVGANGQIGSVLTKALQNIYSEEQVIASDIRLPDEPLSQFEVLDILDPAQLSQKIDKHKITQIYHLAAILSAKGETKPKKAWDLNINGLFNVLDMAREKKINKVFFPSSIAVFGPNAPKKMVPQDTNLSPTTVYGISKVAGEIWCSYYWEKYQVDVRSLRFPGIIGHQSQPGGGTTDYAVDIFHQAVQGNPYTCFLKEDTYLPMIYMPDAIEAVIQLMHTPAAKINVRTSYNLFGLSFCPRELASEIQRHIPGFEINYQPDFRQSIADDWPGSVDDEQARFDFDWFCHYNLAKMTEDMIKNLRKKYLQPIK